MRGISKYDLVMVRWLDTLTYDGWTLPESFGQPENEEMCSIGYFIESGDRYISISSMIHLENGNIIKINQITHIPKKSVLEVRKIKS